MIYGLEENSSGSIRPVDALVDECFKLMVNK